MQALLPLEAGKVYHIYNRGVNSCDLFLSEVDYQRFLDTYAKYVSLYVDTFAYALMKNHFHFLIKVKDLSEDEEFLRVFKENDWKKQPNISVQLGHFFNSYAQYFNKKYDRTGTLFERAFKRKVIEENIYFTRATFYVNANPQHHKVVEDFRAYPYTSYQALSSNKPTKLHREEVWKWFGGRKGFVSFHDKYRLEYFSDDYVID